MKMSLFVFLTFFCLGALAEDLGKERVCAEAGCAATGDMLLQKAPAESGELDPLGEDDAYDEASDVDELIDFLDKGRGGKRTSMPPCDAMKKTTVQRTVAVTKKAIDAGLARSKKCYGRMNMTIMQFKMMVKHLKSCLAPKDGSFVEEGASEGPEDTDDEPEELNELEELHEQLELDEQEEPNELIDTDVEKLRGKKDGTKGLPACDKIGEKGAKLEIVKLGMKIKRIEAAMDNCKPKRLDSLKKMLGHYMKCL